MMMTDSTSPFQDRRVPGVEKDVHRRYGLRITHFKRRTESPARTQITPRRFHFFSLCHLLEGTGWFWMPDGTRTEVPAGSGVLATPGMVVDYGAVKDHWVEDFICFVGPVAEHLMDAGVLETRIMRIGSSRRLLPAIEAAMDPSDDAQIAANSLLQKLLVDLYLENRSPELEGAEKAVADLRALLSREVEQWWTVEDMARECGMSANHLRNVFRKQTGMTPKAYVERLKMMRAAERLCSSNDSVATVAAAFSYQDPYHFSRAFKRVMGLAPRDYRSAHR